MGLFGGGRKPSGSISELTQQLSAHRAAGRTKEALSAATAIDALLRKQFGDRHAAVATNLGIVGELHLASGDLAKAGDVLEGTRAVWHALVGEQHGSYAKALSRLAAHRVATGATAEAIALLDQAGAILAATEFGRDHPDLPGVRAQLAALRPADAPAQAPPPPPAEPRPTLLPSWKTVRVFLSSTFRDMHAERDHLVKVTFPRLRQWCSERRLHLVDIDLRWGVTKEDADNGHAIDICLQEIDGSRPFFICILGDRYGWVPESLPPPGTFAYHDLQSKTGCSITHLEIIHATAGSLANDRQFQKPPVRHAFFYFRERGSVPVTADPEVFVEQRPALADRLEHLKADIRKRFGDHDRVRNYRGRWDPDAPNPEDPALRGRLVDLDALGDAVEKDLVAAISAEFPEHATLAGALDPLTEERARHDAFLEMRTRVFVRRRSIDEEVTRYLEGDDRKPLVVSGPPGSGKSAVLAHVARAWQAHAAQYRTFTLVRFVGASTASTNLFSLVRNIASELARHYGLAEDTGREGGSAPMDVPTDANELQKKWPAILAAAGCQGRTVILIDALDQFDRSGDPGTSGWLLADLPPGVRVVVSAADRADVSGDEAPGWLAAARRLKLPELPVPPLTDEDTKRLIGELPSVFCKRLDQAQIARLLQNPATRNPLFLTVALEELRVFGSFDRLNEAIEALPGLGDGGEVEPAIEALFGQIVDRLDRESGDGYRGLVPAFFSLLASSRDGLTEADLDGLVAARLPQLDAIARTGRVQIVLRQMRPYLVFRASRDAALVSFFHESFRRAVRAKYLSAPAQRAAAHGDLADYYARQPSWRGPSAPNERKAVELPWQMSRAGRAPIDGPLTDIEFVAAKCACALVNDLETDYAAALAAAPGGTPRSVFDAPPGGGADSDQVLAHMRDAESAANEGPGGDPWRTLREFSAFATGSAHLLHRFPEETIAVARNAARSGAVADHADAAAQRLERPWLARDPRPPFASANQVLVRTLGTGATRLSATPDLRTVTTDEGGITVWDAVTGERRSSIRIGAGSMKALALSADGSIIAVAMGKTGLLGTLAALTGGGSIGDDDTPSVQAWDVATGALRRRLPVNAIDVAATADAGTLIVATDSGLDIWEVATGAKAGHVAAPGITRLVVTPDARRAVTSHQDHSVVVWDLVSRQAVRTIDGHGELVAAMAIDDSGRHLVTGTGTGSLASEERAIRVFDLDSGVCRFTLHDPAERIDVGGRPRHFGPAFVTGVAINSDGRIAVSVGADQCLRVWDVEARKAARVIGTPDKLTGVAISPSGHAAMTMDERGEVRLWNIESGREAAVLPGHGAHAVAQAPRIPGLPAGFPVPAEIAAAARTNAVNAIKLARFQPVAVSAGDDATVRVWDMPTGQCLRTYADHALPVHDVAVSHEGLFVTAAGDNTMRLFEPMTGSLREFTGHGGAVRGVDIAGDGATVLSGASGLGQVPLADHSLRVWDLPSGSCLQVLTGHTHWVMDVAFSPDGRMAASGSTDNTLRTWDLEAGQAVLTISPNAGHVERVAYSPDGRFIAAATQNGFAMVFDAGSGARLHAFTLHHGRVNDIAFDASGALLVSGGEDGTVRVWAIAGGACLALYPARSPVRAVSSLRVDGRLACGTADGQVHFLALRNFVPGTPVITAGQRYRTDTGGFEHNASWDCPWCGASFPADQRSPDRTTGCPDCRKPVRVNPFFSARPPMAVVDWRNDPALKGRFHADMKDDIEVLIHDGHPGFTGTSPERAWVRVRGKRGSAWKGTLLNQPFHLKTVSKGDEVMFVAPSGGPYLVMVTAQYLDERREWAVGACSECGITETLCPPSVLLEHTQAPVHARAGIRQVIARCPVCDGTQILRRQ